MTKRTGLAVACTMIAVLVFEAPQTASARDRRLADRSERSNKLDGSKLLSLLKNRRSDRKADVIPAPNGNTGINGSGLPKPTKKAKRRPGRVIPAPNGNTGINGSGLPKPTKKAKRRPGRVIPAPNGNTGINGSGLPRP